MTFYVFAALAGFFLMLGVGLSAAYPREAPSWMLPHLGERGREEIRVREVFAEIKDLPMETRWFVYGGTLGPWGITDYRKDDLAHMEPMRNAGLVTFRPSEDRGTLIEPTDKLRAMKAVLMDHEARYKARTRDRVSPT